MAGLSGKYVDQMMARDASVFNASAMANPARMTRPPFSLKLNAFTML
jgi:hypothetical protein